MMFLASIAGTPECGAGTIDHSGVWETFIENGHAGVGTTFDDGSKMALVVINHTLHMRLRDPAWDLAGGDKVPIRVVFGGGDRFQGAATAIDDTTLDLPIGNYDFVDDFMHEYEANLYVFGARWDVDLTGSLDETRLLVQLAL
jgi:hypothetical protein